MDFVNYMYENTPITADLEFSSIILSKGCPTCLIFSDAPHFADVLCKDSPWSPWLFILKLITFKYASGHVGERFVVSSQKVKLGLCSWSL